MQKVKLPVDFGMVEIDADSVLTNDVVFEGECNPHNVRLWIICNEFGALGAVWASCEQDALDELIDQGLGNSLLVDSKDFDAMSEEEKENCAVWGMLASRATLTIAPCLKSV